MKALRIQTIQLLVLLAAACFEPTGSGPDSPSILDGALLNIPAGFDNTQNSFAGGGENVGLWMPGGGGPPDSGNPDLGGLLGGGMDINFLGGVGFGRGFGHQGPFGGSITCAGSFNEATGRFVCDPVTRDGLTINRSVAYATTSGAVQQAFDTASTNTVNSQVAVSGTIEFVRDSTRSFGHGRFRYHGPVRGDTTTIYAAEIIVNHQSNRSVTGLAQGSTQRVVNGTSAGTETSNGTSSQGAFTATRTAGDTVTGLTIPARTDDNANPYPSAGTVTRGMSATVTYQGSAPSTTRRREVITYNGTATATLVITQDGVTQNCTLALPRGRPACQ